MDCLPLEPEYNLVNIHFGAHLTFVLIKVLDGMGAEKASAAQQAHHEDLEQKITTENVSEFEQRRKEKIEKM